MLSLTGPNSISSLQIFLMKRPSEVPPEVESVQAMPACSRIDVGQRVAELAGRGEEGLAAERPGDVEAQAVLAQQQVDPCLQRLRRRLGAEAEIEVDHHLARDDVARAGAGVDVRHLPGGRLEVRVAAVPVDADQLGQGRRDQVDRVLRQLRIGDVALHAEDAQLAAEGAAAAVLDRVAEALDRGRLADDAVVEADAALDQPVADPRRAVDRRPFLVAGDQQRHAAAMRRPGGGELLGGHDHGGDRALHVGGAAAVEPAAAVRRHERVAAPGGERPGRDDVGVAGEDQKLAGRSRCPGGAPRGC